MRMMGKDERGEYFMDLMLSRPTDPEGLEAAKQFVEDFNKAKRDKGQDDRQVRLVFLHRRRWLGLAEPVCLTPENLTEETYARVKKW